MTQVQSPPSKSANRGFRIPKGLIIAVAVLVVVGAGAWGGITWWHHHQAAVTAAANQQAGDEALADARQDIKTLNTMDYRNVKADYQAWVGATTGTLNKQLTQGQTGLEAQFQLTKVTTTGTVTAVKVVAADAAKGTAELLGTEDVNVSMGGVKSVRHNGFRADLIRTAAGWRLNDFNTTPLG